MKISSKESERLREMDRVRASIDKVTNNKFDRMTDLAYRILASKEDRRSAACELSFFVLQLSGTEPPEPGEAKA